jgi:histidyl-tRNA synthetase
VVDRIQAVRGMNDILPQQTPLYQFVEQVFYDCLSQYGYQELRFPAIESTQLFTRTIGEITDVVEKEMYTFTDLNGDSITLRPEGTAGSVRACLEHGLLYHQQQKLWYLGPMFRHERPQKGRYRQFTQLGVEAYGIPGPYIELEQLALCQRLWSTLGFAESVQLHVNSLGELSERHQYKELLVNYLRAHYEQLDADSKKRLDRNPLRILDSKNPDMQQLIADAPRLMDVLGEQSRIAFRLLCEGLDGLNIKYTVNPFLVRGLDYYGHTVFEWVTESLGSQSTICAGGRYDILVEQLGGPPTPAVGFALGVERVVLLMELMGLATPPPKKQSVFFIAADETSLLHTLALAESVRSACPHLEVIFNSAGGSLKSQFKRADKSGARFAIILGEEEKKQKQISLKDLRQDSAQQMMDQHQLIPFLGSLNGEHNVSVYD